MSINYAKKGEVVVGSILIADDGFTCIKDGARLNVNQDNDGDLYVKCDCGRHYIDGQLDDGNEYIGFTLA